MCLHIKKIVSVHLYAVRYNFSKLTWTFPPLEDSCPRRFLNLQGSLPHWVSCVSCWLLPSALRLSAALRSGQGLLAWLTRGICELRHFGCTQCGASLSLKFVIWLTGYWGTDLKSAPADLHWGWLYACKGLPSEVVFFVHGFTLICTDGFLRKWVWEHKEHSEPQSTQRASFGSGFFCPRMVTDLHGWLPAEVGLSMGWRGSTLKSSTDLIRQLMENVYVSIQVRFLRIGFWKNSWAFLVGFNIFL
jgi:hypothetical protein